MPGATTCNASTALYRRNVVADHDDLVHPTIIVKLYKNILHIYNNQIYIIYYKIIFENFTLVYYRERRNITTRGKNYAYKGFEIPKNYEH